MEICFKNQRVESTLTDKWRVDSGVGVTRITCSGNFGKLKNTVLSVCMRGTKQVVIYVSQYKVLLTLKYDGMPHGDFIYDIIDKNVNYLRGYTKAKDYKAKWWMQSPKQLFNTLEAGVSKNLVLPEAPAYKSSGDESIEESKEEDEK